jgi:glycosyltransferase involved in cell wall biosynthesis
MVLIFKVSVFDNFFRFIYVGRLSSDKSPGLLIHAVHFILSRRFSSNDNDNIFFNDEEFSEFNNKAKFFFYGDGLLLNCLCDMVNVMGLQEIVSFEGFKSSQELIEIMRNSDALINPRITGETFGFVHIEAAACGLPVIAFDSSANRESVKTGILIDTDPPMAAVENLALAILTMFRNRDLIASQSQAVEDRIKKGSIEKYSLDFIEAINRLF